MLPYLSDVSILAVALWLTLELSTATGQAQYRRKFPLNGCKRSIYHINQYKNLTAVTQFRPGRPLKLPQLRSGPDCPSPHFPNGVAKLRQRNKMIRFTCASGFQLVGNMYSMCDKGRWDTSIPICISKCLRERDRM